LEEFAETMRSRLISVFSDALATSRIPALDVATRYTELGEALLPLINPLVTAKYGIEIASFIVENVSVPPEVEEALDKRSSMAAVGDLNEYVKFQLGKGMESGGGGGAGGMATELAVGMAIAQQIMQQQGGGLLGPQSQSAAATESVAASTTQQGLPLLLTPEQVAKALAVSENDVLAIIESGELPAKKIGSNYRVKRSALQAYLED
jgi:excisionase family DNA binding protein